MFSWFANFYAVLTKYYPKIVTPLMCLINKDKFTWSNPMQEAFDSLMTSFSIAPILIHDDFTKPLFFKTIFLDCSLGAILTKYGNDGHLHSLAFYSRKCLHLT
jgi:hypothetical protein